VRVTTSIMIAKAIAAIALTAGTAGGIALATTATPADSPARPASESAAADDAAASSLVFTTPTPIGAALTDLDGTAHAAAADESGRSGGAGTTARTTPEAKTPHPTGLCRAPSNIASDGHPGKAADSPAFADLSCDDDAAAGDGDGGADGADGDAAAAGPAGRPSAPPGNPEHRTGKPDDAGRATDDTDGDDTAKKPGKAGHGAAAHVDTEDRGRSGEHRQDG
jgi:hypothetical protein